MTETVTTASSSEPGKLDDIMLAMDVVDTLRHREQWVSRELDMEGREEDLIKRLKEIYTAQGIDVPESVLRAGVKALDDKRFVYNPPKPSLSVSLAKAYIARDKWLKPVGLALAALIGAVTVHQLAVAGPARARAVQEQSQLTVGLPAQLVSLRDAVQEAASEERADTLAETLYQDGLAAIAREDVRDAEQAVASLEALQADIAASYEVTIISRPRELSGVFRIPDDVPGARNYYLIVEAIDARGRALEVPITSEEDRKSERVTQWGQRVSEAVFNQVAEDKGDDQIIQNAVIGEKPAGRLTPIYRVETPGGAILEW